MGNALGGVECSPEPETMGCKGCRVKNRMSKECHWSFALDQHQITDTGKKIRWMETSAGRREGSVNSEGCAATKQKWKDLVTEHTIKDDKEKYSSIRED